MPKRANSFEDSYQPLLKTHVSDLDVIMNSAKLKQELGEQTFRKLFEAAKAAKPTTTVPKKEKEIDQCCYNCYAEITDGITCHICQNYTCSSCCRSCIECKVHSCWDCVRRAKMGYICNFCVERPQT